jgi:hypothetical protein
MVIIGDQHKMGILCAQAMKGIGIFLKKVALLIGVIVSTVLVAIATSAFTIDTDKDISTCLFINNKNGSVVFLIKRTHQNVAEVIQGLQKGGYEQVEKLPKSAGLDVRCSVSTVVDAINPLVQCAKPGNQFLASQIFNSTKNTTLYAFIGRNKTAMQCPYYGNLSEFIDSLRNKVLTRREIYFSA